MTSVGNHTWDSLNGASSADRPVTTIGGLLVVRWVARPMTVFSPRVPHLFPQRTLARLLTSTYAEAMAVDEEEAHERLTQALVAPDLVQALQDAIDSALAEKKGPRTTEDELLDRVSTGIVRRGGRLRPLPSSPGTAAVIVRINVEIGLAPEQMRAMLASPRGSQTLEQGLQSLGAHLLKELLKR